MFGAGKGRGPLHNDAAGPAPSTGTALWFCLTLDGAGRQAFHNLVAERAVDHDGGRDRDHDGGKHLHIVRGVGADEVGQGDGQGLLRGVGDEDHGEKQLVPVADEGHQPRDEKAGARHGNGDAEEGAVDAAAVDAGGLKQLTRHAFEETDHQKDGHGEGEGGVGQDQRPEGVGQAQLGKADEEGDQNTVDGHHHADHDVGQCRAGELPFHPGDGEGGHGAERQAESQRDTADDDRVEHGGAEPPLGPGEDVVAELPHAGQREGIGENLGVGFEGDDHHPEERREVEQRQQNQHDVDDDLREMHGRLIHLLHGLFVGPGVRL